MVVWCRHPLTTNKRWKSFTDNSANAHTSPNRMVETITPMPAVRLEPLDTLYYLWIVTHQKKRNNIAATSDTIKLSFPSRTEWNNSHVGMDVIVRHELTSNIMNTYGYILSIHWTGRLHPKKQTISQNDTIMLTHWIGRCHPIELWLTMSKTNHLHILLRKTIKSTLACGLDVVTHKTNLQNY